jgi:uncharacterized membrane protein YpjA
MLEHIESLLRAVMEFILRHAIIFWACVVANLLGVVIGGWFWYGDMLMASPVWAWFFIPDCPLAALLGTIGLFGLRYGRRWNFFYAVVAFAGMKYGVWTVAYWLSAWSIAGLSPDPLVLGVEVMLFVTHIGLFIAGLLFVPSIAPLSAGARVGVIGIFVASILVDYGLGYHPPLGPVPEPFALAVALVMTFVLASGLMFLPNTRPRPRVKRAEYVGMPE